jgi:hypothetical protein
MGRALDAPGRDLMQDQSGFWGSDVGGNGRGARLSSTLAISLSPRSGAPFMRQTPAAHRRGVIECRCFRPTSKNSWRNCKIAMRVSGELPRRCRQMAKVELRAGKELRSRSRQPHHSRFGDEDRELILFRALRAAASGSTESGERRHSWRWLGDSRTGPRFVGRAIGVSGRSQPWCGGSTGWG